MKKFSLRRYVSTGLALSFLMIVISGIVLYVAPPGRVARWINWTMIGLNRAQWETQHTLFSYLFVTFGLFHLFMINWKTFTSYLKRRISGRKSGNREAYLALVTALLVFLLTFFEIPPLISVMDIGNRISETWENNIGKLPAQEIEDMTLDEIADMFFGSDSGMLLEQVRDAGYDTGNSDHTLKEIARINGVAPMKIYSVIRLQTRPG
jgi:hypothetical protein